MNFKLQKDINLSELTTFKIGGNCKYFVEISSVDQLPDVFEWLKANNLPYFILSGGSNTIFGDNQFPGLVLKISIKGFSIVKNSNNHTTIKVAAGEDWDKTVAKAVELGLSGIEALSHIPGLAGTAPVQNIGAYGQDIKNVIESVEAYNTKTGHNVSLSNSECKFGYRDSIFKSSSKGLYIITATILKLSKSMPKIPNYPDVINYFDTNKLTTPTLQQIREAIIAIRSSKLPDPQEIPNAGSFFKNPIIGKEVLVNLQSSHPKIKFFAYQDKFKLSAAWLIEHSGLKGKALGHVRVDPNHALVLENTGGASQREVLELVKNIQDKVNNKFGILLEPEPVIVR